MILLSGKFIAMNKNRRSANRSKVRLEVDKYHKENKVDTSTREIKNFHELYTETLNTLQEDDARLKAARQSLLEQVIRLERKKHAFSSYIKNFVVIIGLIVLLIGSSIFVIYGFSSFTNENLKNNVLFLIPIIGSIVFALISFFIEVLFDKEVKRNSIDTSKKLREQEKDLYARIEYRLEQSIDKTANASSAKSNN